MKIKSRCRAVAALLLLPLYFHSVASGTMYRFETVLSGATEAPPTPSSGFGTAILLWDDLAATMRIQVWFQDLTGTVTVAHIHAPTTLPNAGNASVATQVPTFTGFPVGVTFGSYDHTFDMSVSSSYSPGYIATNGGSVSLAYAALFDALKADKAYLNVHSTIYPGGEIRGFWHATPDGGSTALLLSLGLVAMAGITRRRRLGRA
jgi:hypothetical protein